MLADDEPFELSRDLGCHPITRTVCANEISRYQSLIRVKRDQQKLGSSLGPFTAKNHTKRGDDTQNKPKRNIRLANQFLVRDQRARTGHRCQHNGTHN